MTIKLPQLEETLIPNSVNPIDVVNYINNYIDNCFCENMSVDISFMNTIDACYVSTLCSTKHFTKYPSGKIQWKIASKQVCEFNKDFELGNCSYIL
ncbi:hypothetical protein IJ384_02125 [bacterium]|nr:hypothetical protein [bacterium]